jgi:four helix bundle protein
MKTYKDLIVWQKSMFLVTEVYRVTKTYPKDELFSLVSQMRRAAVSIPSNITERHGRRSIKVLIHFLSISLGSSLELETQIIISKILNILMILTVIICYH